MLDRADVACLFRGFLRVEQVEFIPLFWGPFPPKIFQMNWVSPSAPALITGPRHTADHSTRLILTN